MNGLNKTTGQSIPDVESHVRQSIGDIITTPINTRVMRRDYGSFIPDLIDQPLNETTLLRLYAATAAALMRWEPRFKISTIRLATNHATATVEIAGTIDGNTTQVALPVTTQALEKLITASRIFWVFDGSTQYLQLLDAQQNPVAIDVDQVRLLVFPISGGNTGLPTGAPVITNGVWHQLDFEHSGTLQHIGRNGSDYFHGFIADAELLFDSETVFENPLDSDLTSTQVANTVPAPEV